MLRPQFLIVGIFLAAGLLGAGINRTRHPSTTGGETPAQSEFNLLKARDGIARAVPYLAEHEEPTPVQATESWQVLQRAVSGDRSGSTIISLGEISPHDAEILHQLPPVCTAGIEGFSTTVPPPDHSKLQPPAQFAISEPLEAAQVSAVLPHPGDATNLEAVQPELIPAVASTLPDNPSATTAPDPVVNLPPEQSRDFQQDLVATPAPAQTPVDPHAELYSRSPFPSASECATCHQQIYDEWAASSHAYASISPMFNRFEDTINKLTQGTIGYFCMRCHAPVATIMEHPRDQAIYDGPRVFREGVTCIACHRVKEAYTKANGERRIEPGDIFQPVYSAGDGWGNELAIQNKDVFKVKTSDADPGTAQAMHIASIHFGQLSQSDFCMSCHQVAVPPGIKLEVVWDQYRASPAYRAGVICQDCHMGKVPGVNAGYSVGPAAVVSNRAVLPNRKHSNHAFYGPGSSIAHPGLFPQDARLDRWTPDQWLEFDYRAGWGTEAFERQVAIDPMQYVFPATWSNVDDRYDARELIDSNLKKLQYKDDLRRQVLENGSKVDGPFFAEPPRANAPLKFEYCVTNRNDGHNLPSGSLGAQPQLWLNVVLTAPNGQAVWESGYLDSNGDLADIQSRDVLCGEIPFDRQLFNLQTKFLTTNVKGTDREMCLPINFDVDQLPFIRPAPQPVTVINHPPTIRMEAHSLPPTGSRRARYTVPPNCIQSPGIYRLSVRLRSRMEPIYFMRFCGATSEMMQSMNETILDAHPYTVEFEIR